MDPVRLARLFSSPRPLGLSILHHLDPLRARWAGGRRGPAWLSSTGLTGPIPAAFSSSLSQLPLSQRSQKNIRSLSSDPSQPSPTATQEGEEEESFGTLSDKYSSRRMFRKSTAQLYNLRLREQDEEDEEKELEPQSWQGRRNTPYWYFFQCKRLIKEGKVRNLWVLLLLALLSLVAQFSCVRARPPFSVPGCLDAQGYFLLSLRSPWMLYQVTHQPPGFQCLLLTAARPSRGLLICVSSCLLSVSLTLTHIDLKFSFPTLFSLHFLHLTEWQPHYSICPGKMIPGNF